MSKFTTLLTILILHTIPAKADRIFPEPYLNQSNHHQFIFRDGWSGAHLETTYVTFSDTIFFEYCRPSTHPQQFNKLCNRIHKKLIPWSHMDYYQKQLTKQMLTYRAELADRLASNFFSRLFAGITNDNSLKAIDALLNAMDKEPLKFLVLQGPERVRRPDFSSLEVLDDMIAIWTEILNSPVPKGDDAVASALF